METLIINGYNLQISDVVSVMSRQRYISICAQALNRVARCADLVSEIVKTNKPVYGVNTGFGSLCNVCISDTQLEQLQVNMICSHSIGTGARVPKEIIRAMLLLRVNCLSIGKSGVSVNTLQTLVDALNKDVLPEIFEQGTVGASGDLCPLSHLTLGLMGQGLVRDPETETYEEAIKVLTKYRITPLKLGPKEGLALTNGTQFMTSYLSWAWQLANRALEYSLKACALTVRVLHGTSVAFDPRIHQNRPHPGQLYVAQTLYKLLEGYSCEERVQDAYSLRCTPQILGPVKETLDAIAQTLKVEINSVTDNPIITDNVTLSGGNFHGQVLALAADQLAIALSTLANVSERRLERLVNGKINTDKHGHKHLPSFLTPSAGLNSGLMILQYQAAALAAENRQLAAPASVHSIPTCENTEDHVSMGGWACIKALKSAKNSIRVVAAELYAGGMASTLSKETYPSELQSLLEQIKIKPLEQDRHYKPELDRIVEFLEQSP